MELVLSFLLLLTAAQAEWLKSDLVFCTLSQAEKDKCEDLAAVTLRDHMESNQTFGADFRQIRCTEPYPSPEECMAEMDLQEARAPSLMVVDAGDVFVGGRYHSLVPILREVYDGGRDYHHAVAIIKRGDLPGLRSLADLRGSHACFAGVGTQAGWTIPLYNLLNGSMPVVDCNNYVKSTSEFFGDSCAVNTLQSRNNPLGDNSNSLCELCGSSEPGVRCTSQDPYAGTDGALQCLRDRGDIAFVRHPGRALQQPDQFQLLCTDGRRAELSEYRDCSWGVAPGHFILVSSAMELAEREAVQYFLTAIVERYQRGAAEPMFGSGDGDNEETGDAFIINESVKYGGPPDTLLSDEVRSLVAVKPQDQLYTTVLRQHYGPAGRNSTSRTPMEYIHGIRRCDIRDVRLCVTSKPEFDKCQRMGTALGAQLLKPRMTCVPSKPPFSHHNCMELIKRGQADITMLEAGDIYRAGRQFGLVPIMAEVYNLGTPDYYAVAVVKIRDNSSELIYLKRRNSCHTGVGQAAGWVIPMSWLIANERVRDYGCDSVRAASEYFSKSCVPGVRSPDYVGTRTYTQENYWHYGHLCDLCHGTASHYCARNAMEDYYGNTGAFRCLVEGGGDVAFVKHTTVMENCDGKRKEWWARNQLTADYQLLCRDGTRMKATDYRDCYLGKVKANAMVTRGDANNAHIEAFINLFKYAQQFYGQKMKNEFSFSMFYSEPPFADLIFSDAAQKIQVINPGNDLSFVKDAQLLIVIVVIVLQMSATTCGISLRSSSRQSRTWSVWGAGWASPPPPGAAGREPRPPPPSSSPGWQPPSGLNCEKYFPALCPTVSILP